MSLKCPQKITAPPPSAGVMKCSVKSVPHVAGPGFPRIPNDPKNIRRKIRETLGVVVAVVDKFP